MTAIDVLKLFFLRQLRGQFGLVSPGFVRTRLPVFSMSAGFSIGFAHGQYGPGRAGADAYVVRYTPPENRSRMPPPPLMCRAPSSSSLTVRWWQGGTAARAAPPQRAMPKALRSGLTRRWTHGLRRLRGTRAPGGFEPWACRRRRSRTTMGTAPPGAPARPEASPSCGPAATSPGSPRCLLAEAPGRITPVPLVT